MFNHYLDVGITLLDAVWDEGYTFDCVRWPDDMGYKLNQFFSVQVFVESGGVWSRQARLPGQIRKDIARLKTVLRERELAQKG